MLQQPVYQPPQQPQAAAAPPPPQQQHGAQDARTLVAAQRQKKSDVTPKITGNAPVLPAKRRVSTGSCAVVARE